MMDTPKNIIVALAFCLIFLIASCDDPSNVTKKSTAQVVSKTISRPIIKKNLKKEPKKEESLITEAIPTVKKDLLPLEQIVEAGKTAHYESKGKNDPFKPLIQEKSVEVSQPVSDNRPKRILTPLEKIELSQIRLVAVIIMKNKQIAMVEEASGKGYEIAIGTYIGKNQGRVSEIKNNSILVEELIKDYKGRLKEHVQEIKLHKIDNGE